MRPTGPQKDALLQLLTRLYEQIAHHETGLNIVVSESDYRPRIERFHDAVRVYTSDGDATFRPGGRLSVEYLAQDVSLLQALSENPLAPMHTHRRQSASTAVVAQGSQSSSSALRYELADSYQRYAVLFVALLAETADMNYQTRTDEKNAQVEELAALQHTARTQGADNQAVAFDEMLQNYLLDEELRARLRANKRRKKRRMIALPDFDEMLEEEMQAIDAQISRIEDGHTTFVMKQLLLYQRSQEVVKRMAQEGLNIAGKFVEDAMSEVMGRSGRGF